MIGVGPDWTFSRGGTKIASEVAVADNANF
jgi:hypothetical protein